MTNELYLDMARKVIGGYMNADEFSINGTAEKILSVELTEEIFDLPFHKAIVRAFNHLAAKSIPITDYTVLEFLQSHGLPRNIQEEQEYNLLQTNYAITPSSFNQYLKLMLDRKMEV